MCELRIHDFRGYTKRESESDLQRHMPSSPATPSTAVGTFRVVSDECAQFSLEEDFEEDDNDMAPVFPMAYKPESDRPLISNKADSNPECVSKKEVSRTPSMGCGKELSR
uniref:Uncharacterized protein n=1 Tax=Parascaris equorum TaxID=6256 RepID=A0A914RIR2_PAREQ